MNNGQDEKEFKEEDPPVLKSWNNIYTFVLVALAALITIFYFLTTFLS